MCCVQKGNESSLSYARREIVARVGDGLETMMAHEIRYNDTFASVAMIEGHGTNYCPEDWLMILQSVLQGQDLGTVCQELGAICSNFRGDNVEVSDFPIADVVDDISQAVGEIFLVLR